LRPSDALRILISFRSIRTGHCVVRGDQAGHTVLATHATRSEALSQALAAGEDLRSYLAVVEDGATAGHYELGPEPLTVGRDESRHVVLRDAQVSRLHLQVWVADGQVYAEDLGSSNGTFLDGRRITGPVALQEGRWLQVGSRMLKHERRSRRDVDHAESLRRDLEKARSYVFSLLPAPIVAGPVRTDWYYEPSTELGGDAFSYGRLDDEHVVAYLVDVSGHGVGAAMHSVTVLSVLRQRALPNADFREPAQVLASLNTMFQMDEHDGMYFTLWYGVYSLATRRLAFASAGHHPGFLYVAGVPRQPLRTPGPMIGAMPAPRYVTGEVEVPAGAALYLFSDGAFETVDPEGRQRGLDDLLPLLDSRLGADPGEAQRIYRSVRETSKPGPLDDDFSMLVIRFS
jgi:serine phosphatase RsbU (regulator of sigma subunit)